MQFDDILEVIGPFGRYQKWMMFLMCVYNLHQGFVFLDQVFLLGIPEHRCAIPGYSNDTYAIQSEFHRDLVLATIPREDGAFDKCQVYTPANVTGYTVLTADGEVTMAAANRTVTKCEKWVYDKTVYQETFASQMDLVCDKNMLVANAGMVFFLGMMLGSVVGGVLSDRFGRKPVIISSILLKTIASTANSWSSNYPMFLVMQFVKAMELTGRSKRMWPASVTQQAYVVGMLVLAGIAYGLRHWFWIQLVTALPGFLFICYWWLFPESPRWLLTRNRWKEAEIITRKIARWNGTRLPGGLLDSELLVKDVGNTGGTGLLALFATRTLCLRSIVLFCHWGIMAFLYYGLSLNAGNLSGNLYLNFALLTLVECPGYVIVTVLVDKLGRKKLFFLSMLTAGLACLSTIFTTLYAPGIGTLTVVLAMVGKLFTTSAGNTIYLYSSELLPTVARNAGMGLASVVARVGAMVAPYLVVIGSSIGGTFGKSVPMILFGGAAVVSALLVLLLPETLNRNMPETVQEGDKMGKTKPTVV